IELVARALPPHYVPQAQLVAALRRLWETAHFNPTRLEALHRSVQVEGRYLALPVEAYEGLTTFEARNEAWTKAAVELGAQAVSDALARAELAATDVDHLF